MTWIKVRITDSNDVLVDEFSTNSKRFADERIKDWQVRVARIEPKALPLTVIRSDECAVTVDSRTGRACGDPAVAVVARKPVCAAHEPGMSGVASFIEGVMGGAL